MSGVIGSTIEWELYEDGTMRIGGTGNLSNSGEDVISEQNNISPNINEIIIDNGTETIGDNTFNGLARLTRISIPGSVTSISIDAFSECTSLSDIQVEESNQHYSSLDGCLYNKEQSEQLYCPLGKTK